VTTAEEVQAEQEGGGLSPTPFREISSKIECADGWDKNYHIFWLHGFASHLITRVSKENDQASKKTSMRKRLRNIKNFLETKCYSKGGSPRAGVLKGRSVLNLQWHCRIHSNTWGKNVLADPASGRGGPCVQNPRGPRRLPETATNLQADIEPILAIKAYGALTRSR